jgi:hypothetical protein
MKLRIRTLTVIFIILGFPAGISGQTPKRILIFRTVGHTCPKRINFQVHLEDSILRIEKSLILVAPKGESGAVEPPSISAGTLILKSPQRFAVKLSSEEQDLLFALAMEAYDFSSWTREGQLNEIEIRPESIHPEGRFARMDLYLDSDHIWRESYDLTKWPMSEKGKALLARINRHLPNHMQVF